MFANGSDFSTIEERSIFGFGLGFVLSFMLALTLGVLAAYHVESAAQILVSDYAFAVSGFYF